MNTDIKSKAYVYLRRSQDREDRQSLSISKQDAQVRQIITDNQLMPIYLPPEEMSAKKPGRPIFNDMVESIEQGKARYVVVWALSRLSRNSIDAGRVIYLLDTGQLLAIYTPTRVYRNTPDDKAFLAIELAFAKKSNDDLSVQVIESFGQKRERGEYPGPAPLGYSNAIIGPGKRNIVPHIEDAPRVLSLFTLASTGQYTLQDIWNKAYEFGLRTRSGKQLSKQTLADLLHRRMYTGVFKYGGDGWTQGTYEPLITVELYDQVQVAMGWVKPVKRAKTAKQNYPYKGIVVCENCGFNITAYTKPKVLADGRVETYQYYVCTHKSKVQVCKEPQVSKDIIEDEIYARACDYEMTTTEAEKCLEFVSKFYDEKLKQRNKYLDVWRVDHKKASDTIDYLDELLENRTISPERYKTRIIEHEATKVRTKQLIDGASQDAELWLELATEVFSGVVNVGDIFEHANDDERRQLMLMLGSNWTLGNKKVALTPRKPLDLLYQPTRNPDWRARPDSNRRSPP